MYSQCKLHLYVITFIHTLHTVSPAAISKLKESNTHDNYKPFKKLKTFIKKNKNNSKLKITKNLITGRMNNMPPPPPPPTIFFFFIDFFFGVLVLV